MVAGSWAEVRLESPPGGFVATDAVHVYFEVGKSRLPVSVKDLTMKACVRVGLFAVRSHQHSVAG